MEVRSSPDRREKVACQGHMHHLLNGYLEDGPPPPPYDGQLLFGNALFHVSLDAEGGKQVRAHHPVLKLGRLGEQVDQLGSVFNPDWSLHGVYLLGPSSSLARCFRGQPGVSEGSGGCTESPLELSGKVASARKTYVAGDLTDRQLRVPLKLFGRQP